MMPQINNILNILDSHYFSVFTVCNFKATSWPCVLIKCSWKTWYEAASDKLKMGENILILTLQPSKNLMLKIWHSDAWDFKIFLQLELPVNYLKTWTIDVCI